MKHHKLSVISRLLVPILAVSLFAIWLICNFSKLTATQNGATRFFLSLFFSLLILFRSKSHPDTIKSQISDSHSALRTPHFTFLFTFLPILAVILVLFGIIFSVHQFEWLGLLLLLFICMKWSLPANFSRDSALALFVLYWAHPLPGQIFSPMEFAMQKMSVYGSQWFLHMINVSAWADGFVLHTGFRIFEIPAWCSGMRTATTVFLLSLGLGILKRFKWHEYAVLTVVSMAQALALNIIRISTMVIFAPKIILGSDTDYLHDTAGVILIIAVLLVYLEILILDHVRHRRKITKLELHPERMKYFSEHPPFWRTVFRHKWAILTVFALLILTGALAFKSRPYHRALMIMPVAEALRDCGNLEAAERAANQVWEMVPYDNDWRLTRLRIIIIRGKYEQALKELEETRPDNKKGFDVEENILRAYCLMGLKRMDEAAIIVTALPEQTKHADPRLAMIMAEIGYYANNIEQVAEYIMPAASWLPNINRIRALYPYLRNYRKWREISSTDTTQPYKVPVQALCAIEARMNLNQHAELVNIIKSAVKTWPNDLRFMEPLFFMATKQWDTEWEDMFAAHLLRSINSSQDIDAMYRQFDKCFQLGRPDLAWLIYRRINDIHPEHPYLYMCLARYGDQWFSFRKRRLNFSAERAGERIDLRDFFLLGRTITPWNVFCDMVPHGAELATANTVSVRKKFTSQAIIEFEKIFNNQPSATPPSASVLSHLSSVVSPPLPAPTQVSSLSLPPSPPASVLSHLSSVVSPPPSLDLQFEYVKALEMAGNIQGLKLVLNQITEKNPDQKYNVQVLLSEIYERHNDWQNVYETLRICIPIFNSQSAIRNLQSKNLQLSPLLRLCRAELKLHLGLAALYTAQEAARLFPDSPQAVTMLAQTLLWLDSPEEALFALNRPVATRTKEMDMLEAQTLFMTKRYVEMKEFCRSALLPAIPIPDNVTQPKILPPAEISVLWHRLALPSKQSFNENTRTLRNNLKTTSSPFLQQMMKLWLDYCDESISKIKNQKSILSDLESQIAMWQDCGRDRIEKAIALNQLTLLLCMDEKFDKALNTAGKAVKFLPESPTLWNILISLSGADMQVIQAARQSCPNDPEIWLAEIVVRTQQSDDRRRTTEDSRKTTDDGRPTAAKDIAGRQTMDDRWTEQSVICHLTSVIGASRAFSPAAVTRAGEYLFRIGMKDAAEIAARDVVPRARGLIPAYVQGLQSAIYKLDKDWACLCTKEAIKSSLYPPASLYKKFVEIKMDDETLDTSSDMVDALRNLRKKEPDDILWSQMLGYVRFHRGGWETVDALYQMTAAIEGGATNKTPYIYAAEACRLLDNIDRACDLLLKGLELHPDNLIMLNNLVYTLSSVPERAGEAAKFVPQLIKLAGKNTDVMDTIAVYYLRSGEFDKAERELARIAEVAGKNTPPYLRSKIRQAEIRLKQGKKKEATAILAETLKYSRNLEDDDISTANTLLDQCREEK